MKNSIKIKYVVIVFVIVTSTTLLIVIRSIRSNSDEENFFNAIYYSDLDLVSHIYNEKNDVINSRNQFGWTPLIYSIAYVEEPNFDIVKFLIERESDVNAFENSNNRQFVSSFSNKVVISWGGRSVIHFASTCDNQDILNLLLLHIDDVNVIDDHGYTALHHAVKADNIPAIKSLLKHGALILKNNEGKTPLDYANNNIKSILSPKSIP